MLHIFPPCPTYQEIKNLPRTEGKEEKSIKVELGGQKVDGEFWIHFKPFLNLWLQNIFLTVMLPIYAFLLEVKTKPWQRNVERTHD